MTTYEVRYPDALDTEENLHSVHDALRLQLYQTYNPGDTFIVATGDPIVFQTFPDDGYITLTEQCSDVEYRAISFHYSSKTQLTAEQFEFTGLELLPNFVDSVKEKVITHVTQNVMAEYHNTLKDAIIAVEEFVGIKGTVDAAPYGATMEGRINFLHRLVLQPRAWFTANKTMGLVPLTVEFSNKSFQIGENCPVDPITYTWNFGDGDASNVTASTISVTSQVPSTISAISVIDIDGGTITKTYTRPGKYDITLTVTNRYGSDSVVFPDYIHARVPAPAEAAINIVSRPEQILTPGTDSEGEITDGPPFATFPVLRTPVDTFIDLEIESGLRQDTQNSLAPNGRSHAGEVLDSNGDPIDPIVDYTWELTDDLAHANSASTRASYSIGGYYDIRLRVDTENDAYRITTYEGCIDVVERTNIWSWNFIPNTSTVKASEFGLISETFKILPVSQTIERDYSFLESETNADQLIREFCRNTHFSTRGTTASGNSGTGLLYWASGRAPGASPLTETINCMEFNGFTDTYTTPSLTDTNGSYLTDDGDPQTEDHNKIPRVWNWVGFSIAPYTYFLFGNIEPDEPPEEINGVPAPYTSPTNPTKTILNTLTFASDSSTRLNNSNYLDGADELMQNVATFTDGGVSQYGYFSAYRTAMKGATGYLARNSGVGVFFRISDFYRTEGTMASPIQNLRKLRSIAGGVAKTEGQLAAMESGIYFFNNSASISMYDEASDVWRVGTASAEGSSFASLQDRTVLGFSRLEQPLLVVSDGDRQAYITFDYSASVFLKFNDLTRTFTSIGSRPDGEQWMMTVY